jgi:predicted dehydrogenase
MRDVGFGIIGIGRQGLRLAEHIRKDIRPGRLVAVCRRSDAGHVYSKKHGIKFYSNHHDLLQDKDVEAVIITTPSSLHGKQALDSLKCRKHLLIDKPIASNIEDAEEIISLANKEERTVGVNFPLRVNPATMVLKDNLSKIGKLIKIQIIVSHGPPRSAWQTDLKLSDGGVILDLGSHYFDLISFLSGEQPEVITSAYGEQAENEHSGFIELGFHEFSASVVLLRNQKLKKSIVMCTGEKGFVFADYALREVIISNHHAIRDIKYPAGPDYKVILNNLVGAITGDEKIIADAKAGLHSLQVALSAYESIRTASPVRL